LQRRLALVEALEHHGARPYLAHRVGDAEPGRAGAALLQPVAIRVRADQAFREGRSPDQEEPVPAGGVG
jgi:hypothetical protein